MDARGCVLAERQNATYAILEAAGVFKSRRVENRNFRLQRRWSNRLAGGGRITEKGEQSIVVFVLSGRCGSNLIQTEED